MAGLASADETKTARFHPSANGATNEEQIDAQEDREILGVNIEVEPPSGTATTGQVEVYTGVRNFPATGQAQDNQNFFYRGYWDQKPANGYSVFPESDGEWFGDGSGIEWNEDATLTVRLSENGGNGTAEAVVTVYYTEV